LDIKTLCAKNEAKTSISLKTVRDIKRLPLIETLLNTEFMKYTEYESKPVSKGVLITRIENRYFTLALEIKTKMRSKINGMHPPRMKEMLNPNHLDSVKDIVGKRNSSETEKN